jgi:hypothetical protein
MDISQFIQDLIVTNTLYGAKALKLTGISDKNNYISNSLVISSATKTITLTVPVPSFLTVGSLFRIKSGGGSNQDQLFRVSNLSEYSITCNTTSPYFNPVNFSGTAIIDSRIWVIINDTNIADMSPEGNTMFNLDNISTTGLPDGSGICANSINHYHESGSGGSSDLIYSYLHMGG